MSAQCTWSRDGDDSDEWSTSCGQYFLINDAARPLDCKFSFCCFCGKHITETKHEADDDK